MCLALVVYFNVSVYSEVRRSEKQFIANQIFVVKEMLLKRKKAFYWTIIVLIVSITKYLNLIGS